MPKPIDSRPVRPWQCPRPLHERIGWLGKLRNKLRSALFGFLRKLSNTDDAKAIQVDALRNLLVQRRPALETNVAADGQPYPDLGAPQQVSPAAARHDVIIITARFRSGSTLLWNLFRHLPAHTAYYEPFNERRWFDPERRGTHMDATHRQVEDYWREYEGLTVLGQYYQERWVDHDLFMDADDWNPAMKRYVELLIERAAGRPVLQFNRIDFRLPWFRQHFPRAKIVHLYRHPRDQWSSSLVRPAECPRDVTMKDFGGCDHYYLCNWARDLKYHFPFLDEAGIAHPYDMFYYVWKLSYMFGRRYAHWSVAFEDLTSNPDVCLAELFGALNIHGANLEGLRRLIEEPRAGRWRDYAPETWFREREAQCEAVLAEFFGQMPAPPADSQPQPVRTRHAVSIPA